ncbi:MAG: signal peptidase I [Methanobacterium sp.]
MRKIMVGSLCILMVVLLLGCSGSGKNNVQKMSFGGESMAPTLNNGEKLSVDTKAYVSSQPQRGDIIVFKDASGVVMVKRVIGLPGDGMEIKDGKVYVNGKAITENYLNEQNSTEPKSASVWKIPDKNVFILGDNRAHSNDSRDFGPVPYDRILGKVLTKTSANNNTPESQIAVAATAADEWKTSLPEDQGLDPKKLDQIYKDIETNKLKIDSVLIVKNGTLVAEKYFPADTVHIVKNGELVDEKFSGTYNRDTLHYIWSDTKSITSTLVGIACDQGKIKLDNKVVDYFPGNKFDNMDTLKKSMTVRDLLTMRSGLQWPNEITGSIEEMMRAKSWIGFTMSQPMQTKPGTVFSYNTGNMEVVSAIISKTTGMSEEDFAKKYLFGPLNITKYKWPKNPDGYSMGGSGLAMRPRDMAKIGQLMLQNGKWNDKQVVSEKWVKEATAPIVTSTSIPVCSYGYNWWINPKIKMYFASGLYGQTIYVVPQKNMVVVFTANEDINKMLPFYANCIKNLQS